MADGKALTIAQFDKALHNRSAFSCGFAPIDKFLKEALSDHIKAGYLAAYMATDEGSQDVVGFYTLSAFAVDPEVMAQSKRAPRAPTIPAIYIKAVGVHKERQSQGLGTALMIHALRNAVELSKTIGAAAVVLDVLDDANVEKRKAFYQNLGFRPMGDPENPSRVFLSMNDIKASFSCR